MKPKMQNSINKLSDSKSLKDIINHYNLLIFDEKNWIKKEIRKIAEVTYSYENIDNKLLNTTLLVEIWNLNLEKYKSSNSFEKELLLSEAAKKLEKSLNQKKSQIEKALSEVKSIELENKSDENIVSIFINSLEEKESFLNYCLAWLDFELEKAWIDLKISKEEENEKEEEIQAYDKALFWWKIKDNPEETKMSYEYIIEKYHKNKDKLNKEEQRRFEKYLLEIIPYLPKEYIYKEKEKAKEISADFLNVDMPRNDYILSFNILVEALEKLEHIVESNNSAKSISDWPKWVQFPTWEKFNKMNLLRFFKLWNHEIETHNITDYNSKQLLWNLRWAKSTEKDEWLAMLMEQLFIYWNELFKTDEDWDLIIDKEKIQINSYFTKTLMWELLDDEKLLDFLELSEKIDPDVISPIDRFNRLKRNNKKWVQHKDTTYTRWLFKAIDEVNKYIKTKWKEWINFYDLFLAKISFEETHKLKEIKESKINAWEQIEILKPMFISDAVYFILNEKVNWKKWDINWEKFYNFLEKKYPILNFSKEQIKEISFTTKRNVYWIANIMLKNINKKNIENIYKDKTYILKDKVDEKVYRTVLDILENQHNHKTNMIKNKMHHSRKNAK